MSHSTRTSLALGAALVSGLALSTTAFAMTDLSSGYMLGAHGDQTHGTAKPGHTLARMDSNKDGAISRAEFAAAHDGDSSRFTKYDTNKDGAISQAELDAGHAVKKGMEGKCGEGKCGAKAANAKPAKAAEGKCGEGKCGGAA